MPCSHQSMLPPHVLVSRICQFQFVSLRFSFQSFGSALVGQKLSDSFGACRTRPLLVVLSMLVGDATKSNTIQCNTTAHDITQCSATHHNNRYHDAPQFNTTQPSKPHRSTTHHNTTQHNRAQHNSTRHNSITNNTILRNTT